MPIMEITTYTVPSDHQERFEAARPGIAEAMAGMDGLERVESVDLGDGRMVDVVVWRDGAAHASAMETAASDPRLQPLFELVEDVQMRTGLIVA